jgi:hypothetical protein
MDEWNLSVSLEALKSENLRVSGFAHSMLVTLNGNILARLLTHSDWTVCM